MKVLVACEESQEVCKAFRARGHEAYSCDIQPCSGGHPEWHIQGDALDILNPKDHGNNTLDAVWFVTMDGKFHETPRWDLIIAHPPCTYLTLAGNKWFRPEYKERFPDRFYKVVCFCIRLYLLFALTWTICYLVSEIFEKMGVV